MSKNPKVKIDSNLLKELEQAATGSHEVEAVFALRPPDPPQKYLKPEQTQSMVQNLLARVEQETAEAPQDINVFKYLGSFLVVASANFVRKMLEQDEIASAMANRQPDSMELSALDRRAE
jgi:ABC-type dipeptide/oligopeptide/nickel transport system permease component